MNRMQNRAWKKKEICKVLSISTSTWDRWAKPNPTGMWLPKPDLKVGRTHRWFSSTLSQWLVDISKRDYKPS